MYAIRSYYVIQQFLKRNRLPVVATGQINRTLQGAVAGTRVDRDMRIVHLDVRCGAHRGFDIVDSKDIV